MTLKLTLKHFFLKSMKTRRTASFLMAVIGVVTILPRHLEAWMPWSWRHTGVPYQIPAYDDAGGEYTATIEALEKRSPLIFAGECRALRKELAEATAGRRFVLMGGDCAETFHDFTVDTTRDNLYLLLRMAMILSFSAGVPVTSIGRTAGQFAKPRSALWDTSVSPPRRAYQGDIINGAGEDDRRPDPHRMIRAYDQSVQTLNLLRAFRQGGAGGLDFLHQLNHRTLEETAQGMPETIRSRYLDHLRSLDQTIRFIRSTTRIEPSLGRSYTGHECLLLPYEAALTRRDSTSDDPSGAWYATSAHFLWLGERTRRPNASHVEFLRGIQNPIGIKISGTTDAEELRTILDALNPEKTMGRIVLICRMGAGVIPIRLPPLLRAVGDHPVLWCIDPMHGNTVEVRGMKTRNLHAVRAEILEFFQIMRLQGAYPGGIHLEMTSRNVTECVGGEIVSVQPDALLSPTYESACDPRLNGAQALEIAFMVADLLESC